MKSCGVWPRLGFGAGLRSAHYAEVLGGRPAVDWFEAITENYMGTGGRPLAVLLAVRRDFPVALHGVGLSIGSVDPLNPVYLDRLERLVERVEPALVTDHLSWSSVDGRSLFDLLPLPYTQEALAHVVERVARVQERLGRRILLENPSTYITYRASTIPEHEFLAEVASRSDCGILLDVNNVYVSARNHGLDAHAYIDALPAERIGQIHLAGFSDRGDYLFDTHSAPVADAVWDLYARAVRRFRQASTLIEWDAEIPPLARLCQEVDCARGIHTAATSTEQEFHDPGIIESRGTATLAGVVDPRA